MSTPGLSAAKSVLASMEPYRVRVFSRVTGEITDLVSAVEEALMDARCLQTAEGGLPEAPALLMSARTHAESIVAAWFQDEPLPPHHERLLTDTGALGASAGLSDRALVSGAQRAMAAGLRAILLHSGQVAARDEVPGALVASVHQDLEVRRAQLERQVTDALLEGHDRYIATARGERGPQVFVKRLTRGQFDDQREVVQEANAVEFDLSHVWGMVVFTVTSDEPTQAIEQAVGKLVKRSSGSIPSEALGSPRAHTAVLIAADAEKAWDRAVRAADDIAKRHGLFALCYEPVEPLDGLAVQYARAVADLSVPVDTALAPRALAARELAFYRVCTAAPVADRLHMVNLICGRLLDHTLAQELVETLEALSRVGVSAPQIAAELDLHENSVRKRFRTIHELTGLDPRNPQDLSYLLVAIRLRPVRPRGLGGTPRKGAAGARPRRAARGVAAAQ